MHFSFLILIIFSTSPILVSALTGDASPNAYWKFDEIMGKSAFDSSGNGNNGTISGATWTAGKIGNALSFDGINGYVKAGNKANLNINGNQITIEAWVYPKSLSESYIVSKFNGDTVTSGYNLLITQSNIYFRLGDGKTRYQFAPSHGMSTNTWYHIVALYDGKSMKIYKNGLALPGSTSFSGNISRNSNNVTIGQRVGNSYRWNGFIDEVKIYNRALSAAEVLADYKGVLSDTILPTITISSPVNSQTFTTPSITVRGSANDNIAVSKVEVKLNSGTFQVASGTGNWSMPLTLVSGSNTITARATDTSNNIKEASITVTYTPSTPPSDITPPTITISSPINSQTFTTPSITVRGSANDNIAVSKVEVKLNSGTFQVASGTGNWSMPLTLVSGSNTITARATDTSNNIKEASITVTYTPSTPPSDITPPTITISSPINSQTFTTPSITVRGSANDNIAVSKVEVKLNSGTFQVASGTGNWSMPLTLVSGSNTITARATDTSNNIKEASISVTYTSPDTTPPAISAILSSSITSTSASISWTTDEVSDTQIEYGTTTSYGSSSTVNTNLVTSHSQSLSGLTASTVYHYRVKSRDASGNPANSGEYTFTTISSSVSSGSLKLTVDHTKIGSALSDFPILVHLGKTSGVNSFDTSFVLTELGSDANRKKISITTISGTELYVEIEKWDSISKEAWLWVKVPGISSSTDTILNLNYDINRADNTAYVGDIGSNAAKQVWTNGFALVNHYAETGSGVSGEFKDSTSNGLSATGGNGDSSATPATVAAKIGSGLQFDGANDYVITPGSTKLSITTTCAFTLSFWMKPTVNPQASSYSEWYIIPMGKEDNSGMEWQIVMGKDKDYLGEGSDILRWYQYDSALESYGPGDGYAGPWKLNTWEYYTNTASCTDGSHGTPRSYKNNYPYNGAPETWDSYFTGASQTGQAGWNYKATGSRFRVGNSRVYTGHDGYYEGQFDEIEISNVVRSKSWIDASYYSNIDGLLSFI